MRVCWNRQTGTFEGRVFHDVWVQVPSLAPKRNPDTLVSGFLLYIPVSPAGLVDTSAEGARRKCPWGTEAPTEPGGETRSPNQILTEINNYLEVLI